MKLENLYNKNESGAEYWLARHAKALHNKYDRSATFAGGKVDNELTEDGASEAKQLARDIFNYGMYFDVIVSSNLKRSIQTAEIIAKELCQQLDEKKDIPIISIKDLSEVNVGAFTGHTEAEVKEIFPSEAWAFYDGKVAEWNFPEGEDFSQLSVRAKSVFAQFDQLSDQFGKRVLIIGHGMFNRVMLNLLFPEKPFLWKPSSCPHDRIIIFNGPSSS